MDVNALAVSISRSGVRLPPTLTQETQAVARSRNSSHTRGGEDSASARVGRVDSRATPRSVSSNVSAEARLDAALVEQFRSGDRRAFNQLVRKYQKSVFYMALRYVNNDADASDIAQKAFVRAYKSMDGFRGDSMFKTWLLRITINLSLNHIRDNRREQPTDIDDLRDDALSRNPTGAHRVIRSEESQALRNAIQALPQKQRMVLELRIYDELPFREVARLVGCSENAAKVNFHHAVKKLHGLVDKRGVPHGQESSR